MRLRADEHFSVLGFDVFGIIPGRVKLVSVLVPLEGCLFAIVHPLVDQRTQGRLVHRSLLLLNLLHCVVDDRLCPVHAVRRRAPGPASLRCGLLQQEHARFADRRRPERAPRRLALVQERLLQRHVRGARHIQPLGHALDVHAFPVEHIGFIRRLHTCVLMFVQRLLMPRERLVAYQLLGVVVKLFGNLAAGRPVNNRVSSPLNIALVRHRSPVRPPGRPARSGVGRAAVLSSGRGDEFLRRRLAKGLCAPHAERARLIEYRFSIDPSWKRRKRLPRHHARIRRVIILSDNVASATLRFRQQALLEARLHPRAVFLMVSLELAEEHVGPRVTLDLLRLVDRLQLKLDLVLDR